MVSLEKVKDHYKILQSAFTCKNATNPTFVENEFNKIINEHLSISENILYRGLSIKEILHTQFEIGQTIKLNRITSFSEDLKISEDYASNEYGTFCLFTIDNMVGFNYTKHMANVLKEMINLEYDTNKNVADLVAVTDYMSDQLSMINEEKEWMVESGREFLIKDIKYRSRFDMSKEFTIIELSEISHYV